jgi:iron complex transport system ATP-binding protein
VLEGHLSHSYGDELVLKNCEICFKESGLFFLIGKNGAGKTTLLKILSGLLGSRESECSIDKTSVFDFSPQLRVLRVQYLPQQEEHMLALAGSDFLELSAYAVDPSRRDGRISEVVQHFELENLMKRTLDTLSGGERVRIYIASAFCTSADYVFLDEPFRFLDPRECKRQIDLLKSYQRKHLCTIMCASHRIDLALRSGDRVVVLHEGKTSDLPLSDLETCRKQLEGVYSTEFTIWESEEGQCLLPAG